MFPHPDQGKARLRGGPGTAKGHTVYGRRTGCISGEAPLSPQLPSPCTILGRHLQRAHSQAYLSDTGATAAAGPSCWGSGWCRWAQNRTRPLRCSGSRSAGWRTAAHPDCSLWSESLEHWWSLEREQRVWAVRLQKLAAKKWYPGEDPFQSEFMAFVLITAAPGNSSLTRSQQGLALTAGHYGIVDLAEKNDLPTYMMILNAADAYLLHSWCMQVDH